MTRWHEPARGRTFRALMLAGVLALGAAPPLHASEAIPDAVRQVASELLGETSPDAVRPGPMDGLYEIRTERGDILYVSADGNFLFRGDLYNTVTRRNLTDEARREVRHALLNGIDESSLIVFAPAGGSARYTLTVFTDVDCGYCAKFHREVPDLNAYGVKVRYAAWPRAEPGTPSHARSVSVWCAADPRRAMTAAKAGREVKPATCDNPVDEHFELGVRMGVRATPTIFREDGSVLNGYVPWRELVQMLDEG